ncbi:HAD family hydrolase [Actinopolymorpha singaporensis]|uniref:Putative hydrolase of the HAD superfamily n=1 Tax=Actinopolymorpha singaporensis TaxID=117157 RepID=A0A1H1NI56_9ACTN|nr:HAD-IA family hydrolase [Actinopolymorpha singaporensis]SDR98435.1 putative hydrolase of the HAD superfamily [Actinopolymorpha singaporensis]
MHPLTFDALLCDLDGVLRIWDPEHLAAPETANGLPAGALAAAAFAPDRLLPAITGQVSDEQWRAGVVDDLAERHGSRARALAAVDAWSAPAGRVDSDVLDLLDAVRTHVPVVLVSNATTRLERDLAALGLTAHLDAVVNTSRIGVVKPDPRVFRYAAALVGVDLSRCLFVDDQPGNVEAARALGMQGLAYTGPAGLRAALGHAGSPADQGARPGGSNVAAQVQVPGSTSV